MIKVADKEIARDLESELSRGGASRKAGSGWSLVRNASMSTSVGPEALRGPYDARDLLVTTKVLRGVRQWLGDYHRSTIIRIENHSDQELVRKNSKLISGTYVELWQYKALDQSFYFHAPFAIPAQTEVIALVKGRKFPPTGVEGELTFSTVKGDYNFKLRFVNPLVGRRYCTIKRMYVDISKLRDSEPHGAIDDPDVESSPTGLVPNRAWQTTVDDGDTTENNEVIFTLTQLNTSVISPKARQTKLIKPPEKEGFLLKYQTRGEQELWSRRYFVLTAGNLESFLNADKTKLLQRIKVAEIRNISYRQSSRSKGCIEIDAPRKGTQDPYRLAVVKEETSATEKQIALDWVSAIKSQVCPICNHATTFYRTP
jgi:hypothetical protein